MKVFRVLSMLLVMLMVSLSSVRSVRADGWVFASCETLSTDPGGFIWFNGLLGSSESLGFLASGYTFSADEEGLGWGQRERTTRIHFQWVGSGTPTPVNRVDLAYSYSLEAFGPNSNHYLWLDTVGTGGLLLVHMNQSYIDAGTSVGHWVSQSGITAYTDISFSYGMLYERDGGDKQGSGALSFTIAPNTPYYQ